MVMDNKRRASSPVTTSDHDGPQSSSENAPDSPPSADHDSRTTNMGPSHLLAKKRSIKKRLVSVKIGDEDGTRSKGKAYPPSDAWAWRKYGQKPIKGSPYPRGYYRCSSFKGCPARKQVERNRADPTTLIITYAYEHNHPLPTSSHHHHAADTSTASTTDTASPTTPSATTTTASTDAPDDSTDNGEPEAELSSLPVQEVIPFRDSNHLEFIGDSSILGCLGVEYTWVSDMPFEMPSLVWPNSGDADVLAYSIREEDELLFGDLDELPECSIVFRKRNGGLKRCRTTPIYGNT